MSFPIKIYLDQSAYGQFLNQSKNDWKQAEVAKILVREQAAGRAQVWASPTNVLETLQANDRRRPLATIILSLTGAKRMWGGSDFERVRDFLGFFDALAPGFWRQREFYEHHLLVSRRIWIGALALLACPEDLDLSELIETATRNKTISRLLHARFAENPNRFITHVKQTVQAMAVTTEDPFEEIKALPLEAMEDQINQLQTNFQKVSKDALRVLNSNRQDWAQAFGAMEIGRLLQSIFDLPMELMLMVDVRPVVRGWGSLKKRLGWKRSLPKEIATANDTTLLADAAAIQTVLQEMVYAATNVPLLSSYVGYEVIFRELQRCFNKQTIPTGGLSFDADHSAAVGCFEIVISNDRMLVDSLKTIAARVEKQSNGRLSPSIVATGAELEKALQFHAGQAQLHEEEVTVL